MVLSITAKDFTNFSFRSLQVANLALVSSFTGAHLTNFLGIFLFTQACFFVRTMKKATMDTNSGASSGDKNVSFVDLFVMMVIAGKVTWESFFDPSGIMRNISSSGVSYLVYVPKMFAMISWAYFGEDTMTWLRQLQRARTTRGAQ